MNVRTLDADEVAEALIAYVAAKARHQGAQEASERYDSTPADVATAGAERIALWVLGNHMHTGEDVAAFAGQVEQAWIDGHAEGVAGVEHLVEPDADPQPFAVLDFDPDDCDCDGCHDTDEGQPIEDVQVVGALL